jgi:hypothetical protein
VYAADSTHFDSRATAATKAVDRTTFQSVDRAIVQSVDHAIIQSVERGD